jgi:membrane-associated phospholipid phosphatase
MTIGLARASGRPQPADLGINPLSVRCLAVLALVALATLPFYPVVGLSIDWASGYAAAIVLGCLLTFWAYYFISPGRNLVDWRLAESAFALVLLFSLTQVLLPAQYLATALNRPVIDPTLARADAVLGIHLPAIVEWTRQRPTLAAVLVWSYGTFTWQLSLLPILLGVFLRDRDALWEYVFHFYFCAVAILPIFALWPAACAFTYFGFESILNQAQFIQHFDEVRQGSFQILRFGNMTGLVSMPSFHVAGALMVIWSLRQHPLAFWPALVVNALLIVSTVATGAHYLIDLIGTSLLAAVSLWLFRRYGVRWTAFTRQRVKSLRATDTFAA